jgi:transcriptional regulator with XRE-family HTH domain
MKKQIVNLELGQRIKALRRRANLTQEQVAQVAGVSRSFVTLLEQGKVGDVTATRWEGLARALRVDVRDLYRLVGIDTTPLLETYSDPMDNINVIAKRPLTEQDKATIRAVIRAMTSEPDELPTVR